MRLSSPTYVSAEYVDGHLEIDVGPQRGFEFGDIPTSKLVRPGGKQLGFGIFSILCLVSSFLLRIRYIVLIEQW